jgi:hypothetical protein
MLLLFRLVALVFLALPARHHNYLTPVVSCSWKRPSLVGVGGTFGVRNFSANSRFRVELIGSSSLRIPRYDVGKWEVGIRQATKPHNNR